MNLPLPLAALSVKAPSGPAWEFLVLFLVVIIGPPLLERARLPGIIGLLIGGFVIGPNGVDVIGAGNTTIPELGQIGLLYLMFVAGVELDLALLRVHRQAVLRFGVITFAFPMALGSLIGVAFGWNLAATLLLGSLLASHTLLTYPSVRKAGLAAHPAVAIAVGATVVTDTLTLVVLAAVSGSQLEGGSTLSVGIQIIFGLVVLALFCFWVLPRLARLAFRYLGTDRVVRYLLALVSFLGAATLAQALGIEGLVGAFFAGLGMNRLVPNEGPLMERIDFFGSAVFVPVFLVSVGMLLQPSVMVQGETLKYAGLFVVAAVGGKTLAVLVSKRPMRLTGPEAGLLLGLTVPQAAATLAATVIGFDIGLFDQSIVNAALVLILVTIVVATLLVEDEKRLVARPRRAGDAIGKRVLVALEDPGQGQLGVAIGARIAVRDSGLVKAVLSSSRDETQDRTERLDGLQTAGFSLGIDVDASLLVHTSLAEGVLDAIATSDPSLVLVGQRSTRSHPTLGGAGEAVAAAVTTPVAILVGDAESIGEVVLVTRTTGSESAVDGRAATLAAELAARIGGRDVTTYIADGRPKPSPLRAGQLWIAPADSWQVLAAPEPPPGAALVMVLDSVPGAAVP